MNDTNPIWFSDWSRLGEIALTSLLFYLLIVVLTRLSGKRTTSQMNNFDWIITVAVGSLAASGILLKNVPVVDALTAIIVLGICQYAITWTLVRSKRVANIVKAQPTLLTHKGEYLDDAMKYTRVTRAEIDAALRENGIAEPAGANWVILETDGTLSVIPKQDVEWSEAKTLQGVMAPEKIG